MPRIPYPHPPQPQRLYGQYRGMYYKTAGAAGRLYPSMRRDLPEEYPSQMTAPAESPATLADLTRDAPVAFALLDSEFRYVQVNEALAATNRLSAQEHSGRHVSEVVGPDAWQKLEPLLKMAIAGEVIRNVEGAASV